MFDKISHSNSKGEYQFLPVSLLTPRETEIDDSIRQGIEYTGEQLVSILRKLDIEAQLVGTSTGPVVARYKLKILSVIKNEQIAELPEDIKWFLTSDYVRVEIPVPNEPSVMYVEIPNRKHFITGLRELIESPEFANAEGDLTFALGKDVENNTVIADLAKLPHVLIAGETGSGKSMVLHSMITSLLYRYTPDEVKFILIDPKMTEFSTYNDMPHLLVPVITENRMAVGSLQWASDEMMKRYRLFAETSVRNLKDYNKIMLEEKGKVLPRIVVIVDEMAELMLTEEKKTEEFFCRIAQMGRIAGIHLVVATQFLGADIITGLMIANISSRISMKVSSELESQIILDADSHAEMLCNCSGDMLFATTGIKKSMRVQGCFVSGNETDAVVEYLKKSSNAVYDEEAQKTIERYANSGNKLIQTNRC